MPLRTSQTIYSVGPVDTGASIASADVDTNVVPVSVAASSDSQQWATLDQALESMAAELDTPNLVGILENKLL